MLTSLVPCTNKSPTFTSLMSSKCHSNTLSLPLSTHLLSAIYAHYILPRICVYMVVEQLKWGGGGCCLDCFSGTAVITKIPAFCTFCSMFINTSSTIQKGPKIPPLPRLRHSVISGQTLSPFSPVHQMTSLINFVLSILLLIFMESFLILNTFEHVASAWILETL